MSLFKQFGKTLMVVLESKPFTITADKPALDAIKEKINKLEATKSDTVRKKLTTQLMKELKPKVEAKAKEIEKKVEQLKGEKKLAKKKEGEEKTKEGNTTKAKKELAKEVAGLIGNVVDNVAESKKDAIIKSKDAEIADLKAKLEKANEAANKVVPATANTGVRRSGEH